MFLFFSFSQGVFPITPPKEPLIIYPKNPDLQIDKVRLKKKPGDISVKSFFPATILFKNKVKIAGNLVFKEDQLRIQQNKNGITFSKNVFFREIARIKILAWLEKTTEKTANHQQYFFLPAKYAITLKAGKVLLYEKNIEILNQLLFQSEDGEAKIYTYFVDYWIDQKRWFHRRNVSFASGRYEPLSTVVEEIVFD